MGGMRVMVEVLGELRSISDTSNVKQCFEFLKLKVSTDSNLWHHLSNMRISKPAATLRLLAGNQYPEEFLCK